MYTTTTITHISIVTITYLIETKQTHLYYQYSNHIKKKIKNDRELFKQQTQNEKQNPNEKLMLITLITISHTYDSKYRKSRDFQTQ